MCGLNECGFLPLEVAGHSYTNDKRTITEQRTLYGEGLFMHVVPNHRTGLSSVKWLGKESHMALLLICQFPADDVCVVLTIGAGREVAAW